jgi:hypothetical protein
LSLNLPTPSRLPILYVILSVLVLISVVPMYFYSAQVESINRDRLITNERLLQNTVTRSLADDISQHQESLRMMQANLGSALQVASGGDITSEHVEAPELRALLENFVSSSDDLAYATLLNADAKGISAGRIAPDAFLQRELERAYSAAREARVYNGQALVVGTGKSARTVMLVSTPVMYGGSFLGMIGSVVDLQFLIRRLQEVNRGGLTPYVVDSQGRLVAGATSDYATGQDMSNLEIVRNFVEAGTKVQMVAATREFNVRDGNANIRMLGTQFGNHGHCPEHRHQYFRRPPDYESAASPYPFQPGHRRWRLFTTRSRQEPHRDRRTSRHLQCHVRRARAFRARPQTSRNREP